MVDLQELFLNVKGALKRQFFKNILALNNYGTFLGSNRFEFEFAFIPWHNSGLFCCLTTAPDSWGCQLT